jgi:Domain of unknown function (DUF4062)
MAGVPAVFISSVQRDYAAVRAAVRRAVEVLHMRPLMAEMVRGARPESPQRALLDQVGESDVLVLIVGPRYSRPTEDEFDEARRLGRPIVVLKQRGELEPDQQAFLAQAAGGWAGGRMWAEFTDENDVFEVAVESLSHLAADRRTSELAPTAQARARDFADGERRHGYGGHRSVARVVLAPLGAASIVDALRLDDALGETVADLARSARLVPHSLGINADVRREGVSLVPAAGGGFVGQPGFITVAPDGTVVAEVDVGGEGTLAGTRVDSSLLASGIESVGSFALRVWDEIDRREEIQQVAVVVAILDAQYKVFDLAPNASSYSMGTMTMPSTVIVPEPAVIVRRGEVAGEELSRRLVAEIKRVFADAGAISR